MLEIKEVKTLKIKTYREFISALVNERKRLNISQQNMALQLGISQADLSRFENFKQEFPLVRIIRYCELISVEISLSNI